MDPRTRLGWIRLNQRIGDAGVVCRRCGISRPTVREWWRRYQAAGDAGLIERSRRPCHSPRRKVFAAEEALILDLRRTRRLGIKRLRAELIREHALRLSLDTTHKILLRHGESRLARRPARTRQSKRYARPVPGERVQFDVCKIAPGLYQYTAVDDCTRWLLAALYVRKTAANTLAFLERVRAELPFPIQRVQTDRGQEVSAYRVQDQLRAWQIKFRPIRARSPHLNDKVERAQRTVLDEFWAHAHLAAPDIADQFADWLEFYNTRRPHSALGGLTPAERLMMLQAVIPTDEAVSRAYEGRVPDGGVGTAEPGARSEAPGEA